MLVEFGFQKGTGNTYIVQEYPIAPSVPGYLLFALSTTEDRLRFH